MLLLVIFNLNGGNALGISKDRAWNDILLTETELGSKSEKHADRTDLTLEQCYGRIGRWLTSKNEKNEDLTKARTFHCVHCGRSIPNTACKGPKNGKGLSQKCFRVEAIHCKGSSKTYDQESRKGCYNVKAIHGDESFEIDCRKKAMKLSGVAAEDSKLHLLRSANTKSQAIPGHVPALGPNAISGSVQGHEGDKMKILKGSVHKTADGWDDHKCIFTICCELCCPESVYYCSGYCLECLVCGPFWLLCQGCRFFCGLFLKGLDKCLTCCCGDPTQDFDKKRSDMVVTRHPRSHVTY